jgi:hypothetical protein
MLGHRPFASIALAAGAMLVGCGGNTGDYAPSPKPFEPPSQDIGKAKDPQFKALIQAVQEQRKLAKQLADFRASFGESGLDENAGKKYKDLFAKTANAAQKVADIMNEAKWEGEDKRIVDLIMSLSDDQINTLVKGAPAAP